LAAVFIAGIWLRAARIDEKSLWVDEAESSLNGLTILEHGLPVSHYMGLPIYENTLSRPWPESLEYEFRDTSYSDRGLAVYHGWLPLYSIALAEWMFGVTPDHAGQPLVVRYNEQQMLRRTWVPRLPAVVFSGIFLAAMYFGGRAIGGEAAGWAALAFAVFGERLTWFGTQARYYSATLAFDATCAWSLWACIAIGRWRHFVWFAFSLVLLFFTHMLSCFAVLATALCMVPLMWRHERLLAKIATAVAIFCLFAVPWEIFSGHLTHVDNLPKARELLIWPDDYLGFLLRRKEALALLGVSVVAIVLSRRFGWAGPDDDGRLNAPAGHAPIMIVTWVVAAYGSFCGLMPAASFIEERLTMTLEVPGILLTAAGLAAATRRIPPRIAPPLAALVVLTFLWASDRLVRLPQSQPDPLSGLRFVFDGLRQQTFAPDTRMYTSPNLHLSITYYTGLPVQSIAPVRKDFLNDYPGPIVILEPINMPRLRRERVEELAREVGIHASGGQLGEWRARLDARLYLETVRPRVASTDPPPLVPRFLEPALDRMRQLLASPRTLPDQDALLVRRQPVAMHRQWWQTFFYRFVDPKSRMGEHANYAQRERQAHVKFFSYYWAAHLIPPLQD
jgi:hypothetical protein